MNHSYKKIGILCCIIYTCIGAQSTSELILQEILQNNINIPASALLQNILTNTDAYALYGPHDARFHWEAAIIKLSNFIQESTEIAREDKERLGKLLIKIDNPNTEQKSLLRLLASLLLEIEQNMNIYTAKTKGFITSVKSTLGLKSGPTVTTQEKQRAKSTLDRDITNLDIEVLNNVKMLKGQVSAIRKKLPLGIIQKVYGLLEFFLITMQDIAQNVRQKVLTNMQKK